MKILVALDGSPRALAALDGVLQRLDWFRDQVELSLIYAHAQLPYKRAVAWAGKDAVHAYYEEESEEALAEARKLLASRNIAYGVEKVVGDPATQIVERAQEGGFDLIVMGSHGRSALESLVVGSVATKVLAKSTVPVLFMH
jgi:nucleotide-binding universal stress UspA family protein